MTQPDPITALLDVAYPADRETLATLVVPVAGGAAAGESPRKWGRVRKATAPAITDSYVGGHPFLPTGQTWPVDAAGEPMHFVAQVNFADVPALPGFPTSGLLQMFVASDDTWGLTFDDTMGLTGFHCRWYTTDDLRQPVEATSASPIPIPHDSCSPVTDSTTPRRVAFTGTRMLPQGWEHLQPDVERNPRAFEVLADLWEEHEDLADATLDGWDVQVGGWPSFVQSPPAVPSGRSAQLILGFGSSGLMMWGDVGTAHLFGDPTALAAGDLSGLWWEWACG